MAEVIGAIASGITLAALLRTCLDAFDIIYAAKNHDKDLKRLVLKLNIEKCKLRTWGLSLGLLSVDTSPMLTESDSFHGIVCETLEEILSLFGDAGRLKARYGCIRSSARGDADAVATELVSLTTAMHLDDSTPSLSSIQKLFSRTRWAVKDRKKFMLFIGEIQYLVRSLREITEPIVPLQKQEQFVAEVVERVNDVETLEALSEAC